MKVSISYNELSGIILDKTGKNITFEFSGQKETVIARIVHIPCYITLMKVDSKSVTLSHQIGNDPTIIPPGAIVDPCPAPGSFFGGLLKKGAQVLGQTAVNAVIENFFKHPAVSVNEDKTLTVELEKIPQLSKALEMVELNGISFDEEGVVIDACFPDPSYKQIVDA